MKKSIIVVLFSILALASVGFAANANTSPTLGKVMVEVQACLLP